MRARVERWGEDLAIRIPKEMANKSILVEGADVELTIESDHPVVTPVRERKYTLDALLAEITDENRHDEIDFGPPVGKEIW